MPEFHYKVKTNEGELQEGTMSASNRFALSDDLKKGGREVVSIDEVKTKGRFDMDKLNLMFSRIKLRDKIVFARNLSAMIDAGLPLSRSLEILKKQTKNKKFQNILSDIAEEINKGKPLSLGLAQFPDVFPSLFVSMVRAGEESGTMSASLDMVAVQLEKSYNLRKKIRGALIYPAIVVSAMVVIGILMLIYVVPTLSETFSELGADLPASTQFILTTSDFFKNNTLFALFLIMITVGSISYALKTTVGKRAFHFAVLRIPVIGTLVKESNTAYATRTLSSLLSSGVEVIEAITISRDVVQNVYFKDVMETAIAEVQKGGQIHKIFSENTHLFPLLVGEMTEVGEETGRLSEMLLKTATFYEDEVATATKDMSTIIEPFLMLIIASGVGFFAVSMITPIYSLMTNV